MKLNPEHKHKYVYLLAYAASVFEKGNARNKDDLKVTAQGIEKVHVVSNLCPSSAELIAELAPLYQCIK